MSNSQLSKQIKLLESLQQNLCITQLKLTESNNKQLSNILEKAVAAYLNIIKLENPLSASKSIEAINRLLAASSEQERDSALAALKKLAYELPGHPSKKKKYLGAALIFVGIIFAAVTLSLFLAPVAIVGGAGAMGSLIAPIEAVLATFAKLIGCVFAATYSAGLLKLGASLVSEGRGCKNSIAVKLSELHDAFFSTTPAGNTVAKPPHVIPTELDDRNEESGNLFPKFLNAL